jgi:hypothetical protein
MPIIICPGIHETQLTADFLTNLQLDDDILVLPTQHCLPYASWEIYRWLEKRVSLDREGLCSESNSDTASSPCKPRQLLFIAFSAGVVGSIGAAIAWQIKGGNIKGLIAIDGWGVPLIANFPIYRLSHDYFTHWSSAVLGGGEHGFYCDPPIAHLDLWRSPHTAWGWKIDSNCSKVRCSAASYIKQTILMVCKLPE